MPELTYLSIFDWLVYFANLRPEKDEQISRFLVSLRNLGFLKKMNLLLDFYYFLEF